MKIIKRVLSLSLCFLLVLSFMTFLGEGPWHQAVAKERKSPARIAFEAQVSDQLSPKDKVKVIVRLKEDSVSLQSQKATPGRKRFQALAKKKQKKVKEKIKNQGIAFREENNYSLLFSGFSTKVSYEEAQAIADLPEVASVEACVEFEAPKMAPERKMADSVDEVTAKIAWSLGIRGEGRLIAVIDSGADPQHKDFVLTDPSKAKYSQEAMKAKIREFSLPGSVFSDKMIYGFNYMDHNQNIKEDELFGMHGMIVAGICAANGDPLEGGVRGVAPESQLAILRVFSDVSGVTDNSVILKALEDAVLLQADSINMSLGSPAGIISEVGPSLLLAMDKAAAIGSVVNIAAGNEGYFGRSVSKPRSDAPDYGLVSNPAIAPTSLAVASMNNAFQHALTVVTASGKKYGYQHFGSYLPKYCQPLATVDCKLGRKEDFIGKDIAGKVALIERGEINFIDKVKNAEEAGAALVLIYNHEAGGQEFMRLDPKGFNLPVVTMFHLEGKSLAENPEPITFTKDDIKLPSIYGGAMSEFSTWGMTNEGDLKPEISAPGGNIYSTLNEDGYGEMSGTSMATPHVAAGVALVGQRVQQDFPEVSGIEFHRLVKNLLMSTAIPHEDEKGRLTSPRSQGAGIMNLSGAVKSNVIAVSADTGEAKINCKEVGNQFTLKTKLINLGSEDVTFTVQANLLTDEVQDGLFTLKSRTLREMPMGQVTVPAKGSQIIEIPMDAGVFEEELSQLMPKGYFLEGFLRFTSETVPSLSLPFAGFHGVWMDLPVLEKPIYDFPMAEQKPFYYQGGRSDFTHLFTDYKGDLEPLGFYPEWPGVYDGAKLVLSPNGDQMADQAYFRGMFLRNFKDLKILIQNEDGQEIYEASIPPEESRGKKNHFSGNPKYARAVNKPSWRWNGKVGTQAVKDGIYRFIVAVTPDLENATPQQTSFPLMVDTTPPEVETVFFDPSTGKLKITAKDALSGVYKMKVSLAQGAELQPQADGSYLLPQGTDLSQVLVELTDFGFNTLKDSLKNAMAEDKIGSLRLKGACIDDSLLPSYKTLVTNEAGEIMVNLNQMPLGTYQVKVVDLDPAYRCLNPEFTVTLTENSPKQMKLLRFEGQALIKTKVLLEVTGEQGYLNQQPVFGAESQSGQNILFAQDEMVDRWYSQTLSQGNYTLKVDGLSNAWHALFMPKTFTVKDSRQVNVKVHLFQGGGHIQPQLFQEGNLLSQASFEARDAVGRKVDLNQRLPYGTYQIYPVDLPEGMVTEPVSQQVTLSPSEDLVRPAFHLVRAVNGSITINLDKEEKAPTVTFKAIDEKGVVWTDLRNLPLGTYQVLPQAVPLGYRLSPESQELKVTKEEPAKTANFSLTSLSQENQEGSLYVQIVTPLTYRRPLQVQILDDQGRPVRLVTVDPKTPEKNRFKLPYGLYGVEVINVLSEYYAEPKKQMARVDGQENRVKFVLIEGKRGSTKVTSIVPLKLIEVEEGTKLSQVVLPQAVEVKLSDGSSQWVPVQWDRPAMGQPESAGTYEIKGHLEYPASLGSQSLTSVLQPIRIRQRQVRQDGEILVTLQDAATGKVLDGASFVLEKGGVKIAELRTNRKGQALFKGLELGDYTLRQIRAPRGFLRDRTHYTVSLTPEMTQAQVALRSKATQKSTDTVSPAMEHAIQIVTVDEMGQGLPGASYELIQAGKVLRQGQSNEKGQLIFTGLLPGDYEILQRSPAAGYLAMKTKVTVTLDPNMTQYLCKVISAKKEP